MTAEDRERADDIGLRAAEHPLRIGRRSPQDHHTGRHRDEVDQRAGIRKLGDLVEAKETGDEGDRKAGQHRDQGRSEEHTSELQSLMRISYAVFCLKKKNKEIQIY